MSIAILIAAALGAASSAQETPAPPERDAGYHNAQQLFLLRLDPADGWRRTASGLAYRRIGGDGSGPRPSVEDTVTLHYVGRFIDGTEFDSSVARGEPATFPLGRLIRGWQEGVPLMTIGDRFEFVIPWHLAYGPAGRGPIPGGATLRFTVELLGIAPRPSS